MIVAADPDAGIAHLAGIGLGVSDELRVGLRREVLDGGGEDERHLAEARHHQHVLIVVDLEFFLVDDRREHIGARIADLQRVAVGPRPRHLLDGENAERSGLVLDDDRLAEDAAHLIADDADDDVGRTARAERHHDLDRLRGKLVLRVSGHSGDCDETHGYEKDEQPLHVSSSSYMFLTGVVPAEAGTHDHRWLSSMGPRFRGDDSKAQSVRSIFTSAVVLRQLASSPFSQDCASSSDSFGFTLTSCLAKPSCNCGTFEA